MAQKSNTAEPQQPRSRRRWFQFRLRTLLVGATMLSVLTSSLPLGRATEPSADEAVVIAEIKRAHGSVVVDKGLPGNPVVSVKLEATKIADSVLAHLKALPQLKSLSLESTLFTDDGLAARLSNGFFAG
jgi:hypothetical protein